MALTLAGFANLKPNVCAQRVSIVGGLLSWGMRVHLWHTTKTRSTNLLFAGTHHEFTFFTEALPAPRYREKRTSRLRILFEHSKKLLAEAIAKELSQVFFG